LPIVLTFWAARAIFSLVSDRSPNGECILRQRVAREQFLRSGNVVRFRWGDTLTTTILVYFWVFCTVAFLVDWIRLRRQLRQYIRYGITVGTVFVGLELLMLGITPAMWGQMPLTRVLAYGIDFLKMAGLATLGIHYCMMMGRPSVPLLLPRSDFSEAPDVNSILGGTRNIAIPTNDAVPAALDVSCGLSLAHDAQNVSPGVGAEMVKPSIPQVDWRTAIFAGVLVVIASAIYSILLFWVTSTPMPVKKYGVPGIEVAKAITPQVILFVMLKGFGEEIVYRLGVQNFLAQRLGLTRGYYWIAILITATAWTIGHAGILNPEWVKLAQVFPMGLLLGTLCKRYGVESSILAHVLFNVVMLFAPLLLLA
jgi:membrane protease YdiL (CAAX protease family)